jgi:16S rRNA (cytosine967-C5)-methyltransferase
MRENARRVGRPVSCVVADAVHPPIREAGAVLLDVPCSGTGTLARHPDARWRLTRDAVEEMAELQGRMLAAAADVVQPGGLLVYSTCTLEPEENGERVAAFLERRQDYALEPTDAVPRALRNADGCLEMTPQQQGFDGSFAARLRRVA